MSLQNFGLSPLIFTESERCFSIPVLQVVCDSLDCVSSCNALGCKIYIYIYIYIYFFFFFSNSVFIDCFNLVPPVLTGGGGCTFMHVINPRVPPSEERISPVTELTWQLEGVEKGHSMCRD